MTLIHFLILFIFIFRSPIPEEEADEKNINFFVILGRGQTSRKKAGKILCVFGTLHHVLTG